MTKKINLTNLREIKTIRIKCNNCGAVLEIPAGVNSIIPLACANCEKIFAQKYRTAFGAVRDAIVCIDDLTKLNDNNAEVEFLTDCSE